MKTADGSLKGLVIAIVGIIALAVLICIIYIGKKIY